MSSPSLSFLFISTAIIIWNPFLNAAQRTDCPSGRFLDEGRCQMCPPGTFRNSRVSADCTPCEAGTFNPLPGAVGEDFCRPCSRDTFSTAGSSECTPCPSGRISVSQASRCVRCGPGFELTDNRCIRCEPGTFSNTTNTLCERCPGTLTSPRGATSVEQCRPCTTAEIRNGCLNNQCRQNEIIPSPGAPCQGCPPGFIPDLRDTGMGIFGQPPPARCRPCPRGRIPSPRFFPFFCRRCSDGTGTMGPGASFCQVNGAAACPTGLVRKNNGDCVSCPGGQRFNPAADSCEQCPSGMVSPGGNSTACVRCRGRLSANEEQSECTCPLGEGFDESGRCRPCPPGTAHFGERGSCSECNFGFTSTPGSESCFTCPVGSIPNRERGATGCTPCGQGFTSLPDTNAFFFPTPIICVLQRTGCPPGFRRSVDPSTGEFFRCERFICPTGTPPEEVGRTCLGCEPGDRLLPNGRCVRCPRNSVSDGGFTRRCTQCPFPMVRNPFDRARCGCIGSGPLLGQGLIDGECRRCPRGTFRQRGGFGALSTEECTPCPRGEFTNRTGSTFCDLCPLGTFSDVEGATECRRCPDGFLPAAIEGAKECVLSA